MTHAERTAFLRRAFALTEEAAGVLELVASDPITGVAAFVAETFRRRLEHVAQVLTDASAAIGAQVNRAASVEYSARTRGEL